MNEKDLGKFYTTKGDDVWRLITYCSEPTATLENVETKERVGGVVGCRNLQPFIKLIPETEVLR